jgi:glycosyltransferase involved in cell wall biosynthesis
MSVRIGLDATPLLGPRTGVGYYTSRLLAAMLAADPEWRYLLYSNRSLEPLEPALARATPVYSRLSGRRMVWMQCLLPPVIRSSRAQLCHFPNAMAPLWQQQPFVLTIHDASLFLYAHTHPLARLVSIRLILPLLARRAAAIITVSHHARNDLLRILHLPPEKVHVIYEAAPEEFRPVNDPAILNGVRQKYGLPPQFLLYVGTLEPRKNLRRLLRALHEIRRRGYPHKLVMVGPPGWHLHHFYEEIERLSLQDRVSFTGYVPAADLPALYSLASLFVFPSLYEGFGLPPLEAMACGAPVLASNRTSLPEICGDAAHLVDPEDEAALVNAMLSLLSDDERRRELSRRGPVRARLFSWKQAAQETMTVYCRVLNGSGGHATDSNRRR